MSYYIQEYLPGIIGSAFFVSLSFLVYYLVRWTISNVRHGWWADESVSYTWEIWKSYFIVALTFSIMVMANPGHDASYLLLVVIWALWMFLYVFYRMQCDGAETEKWTV